MLEVERSYDPGLSGARCRDFSTAVRGRQLPRFRGCDIRRRPCAVENFNLRPIGADVEGKVCIFRRWERIGFLIGTGRWWLDIQRQGSVLCRTRKDRSVAVQLRDV